MRGTMKALILNLRLTAVLLLICSVLYPAAIRAIAAIAFNAKAEGSLIRDHGPAIGSRLIGQQFVSPAYFHGRPSATTPPYNAAVSGASNFAPTNPALFARMADEVMSAAQLDGLTTRTIASDRVFASGSGLDPDISPENALQQVDRVAREHGLDRAQVAALVQKHTRGPVLGIAGPRTVNVLSLNLSLDAAGRRK